MKDPTPLPHLQFAVLGVLASKPRPGREIRAELEQLGVKKAGPTFYRLMSRMEEARLVEGWYEQDVVDGQIFRERFYRALPEGATGWERTRAFHVEVMRRFSEGEGAALA